MGRMIGPRARAAAAVVAAWMLGASGVAVTAPASAADVTALAIMLPEEPTDFGWNQQAFEAAKADCTVAIGGARPLDSARRSPCAPICRRSSFPPPTPARR